MHIYYKTYEEQQPVSVRAISPATFIIHRFQETHFWLWKSFLHMFEWSSCSLLLSFSFLCQVLTSSFENGLFLFVSVFLKTRCFLWFRIDRFCLVCICHHRWECLSSWTVLVCYQLGFWLNWWNISFRSFLWRQLSSLAETTTTFWVSPSAYGPSASSIADFKCMKQKFVYFE